MFRNDAQLARVCETLCRLVRLHGMWTWSERAGEATPKNRAALRRTPGWSHGEVLMWQVAWAVWNGDKKPNLYEMIGVLDGNNMQAVGSLLVSIGAGTPAAIDDWLEVYRACEVCGCTQDRACVGGCAWRDLPGRDICTSCSAPPPEARP